MKLLKLALLVSSVCVLTACGGDSEPAECTAYFETVNACVAKLNPQVADQFKKTFEEQKKVMFENDEYKKLSQEQKGQACKIANNAFKQQMATLGCK